MISLPPVMPPMDDVAKKSQMANLIGGQVDAESIPSDVWAPIASKNNLLERVVYAGNLTPLKVPDRMDMYNHSAAVYGQPQFDNPEDAARYTTKKTANAIRAFEKIPDSPDNGITAGAHLGRMSF